MEDLKELEIAHTEHESWLSLCRVLKTTRAVTKKDLQSKVGLRVTRGQLVLELIRQWGEDLVTLRKFQSELAAKRLYGEKGPQKPE